MPASGTTLSHAYRWPPGEVLDGSGIERGLTGLPQPWRRINRAADALITLPHA
jgi:hypothetical protein